MLPCLEADRVRIADPPAQISHLEQSQSSALREEKILAQERLDSYKYPVLTLPNEIISEIFMHFLPPYPQYPPLTGLLSPTLLTHICRKWREIALSTPALWSAIGASYDDGIPLKQKAHIFDIWLKSSQSRPLSLQIIGTDVAKILGVLVPHRARWEHLELECPSLSHLPVVVEGQMPLLRHLHLELGSFPAPAVRAFLEVPLLRTVVLNDHVTVDAIDVPNFARRLPARICPGFAEDIEPGSLRVGGLLRQ
jgi:hypothetical protein